MKWPQVLTIKNCQLIAVYIKIMANLLNKVDFSDSKSVTYITIHFKPQDVVKLANNEQKTVENNVILNMSIT